MHLQKPMLGTPLDWSNPLNKGLVMHLAMNEGHGDRVQDLSMNGNHGTLNGFAHPPTVASGWNPGRNGVGLNFDGSNDYIDCGAVPEITNWKGTTMSCLIKPSALGGVQGIMGKYAASNNKCQLYANNNDLVFGIGVQTLTIIDALTNGIWNNIIAVLAHSKMYVYVDGVEHSRDFAGNVTPIQYFYIGQYYFGGLFFGGSIDQTRIINRIWSTKEVKDYAINPWQVYLDEDD